MDQCPKKFSRNCAALLAFVALLVVASCGGGGSNSSTTTTNPSGFASRIYVLENFFGRIFVINAATDQLYAVPISVPSGVTVMALSPDKNNTYLISQTSTTVYQVDNTTEKLASFSIPLPAPSNSMAVLSDNKTAVAASRNAPVSGQPVGAVFVLDITNQKIGATISVPEARSVVVNHAGNKILAFADNTNSFYVIDTTANTATPIQNPALLDRPVNAVFSADDSKAYILNCGAECGGNTASVTVFNPADNSLGANVPVSAATVGLLDNNKLYVAGSANNAGQLDVIDTGTLTAVQTGIGIANGTHSTIAMADGGNLYIGSIGCNNSGTGCLSVFPVSGQTATTSSVIGDVAAMVPILGRNMVYVAIGGELVMYDTTTSQPRPNRQFDVVGNASGLLRIN